FEALNLTEADIEKKFGFFIEALKYGTPPHAGLAYGLDRLLMLFAKTNNIKDVIAFPKTQSATCPLSEAPTKVDDSILKELYINIRSDNNGNDD
ncbi:amino acid--tRNA ligase-related protein, partial [Escherichia coli]|uniref:amino acid--tRNA ligase-related protein n=1 Tax=Escherichia coli TaxID=562 RepID=UPI00272FE456